MKKYILTCNCYEPMYREKIVVNANNVNEAWDKAKMKSKALYGGMIDEIHITAVEEVTVE